MEECVGVSKQEITLSDYRYLDIELDNLFSKKYRKNGMVAKYIYYGIDPNDSNKEIGKYVLINTKDNSWKITTIFSEAVGFLQLDLVEYNDFIQDIKNLIIKEAKFKEIMIKANNLPKHTYTKKLNYILKN